MINKNKTITHRILNVEYFRSLTKEQYLYLGLLVGFIAIATVISSSFSRDSLHYNRMFEVYGASGWGGLTTEMFSREAFILVVSKILHQLGLSSVFLFLVYSAISLSVKFYLIYKHSKDKWLSLALFGSYFFVLHDSTQIRFGMAVAFVYLALHYLSENRKLLFSAIVIFSAIMFHAASLVFIVMLIFSTKRSLLWLFGMVAVAILLYPVNLHIILLDLVGNVINFLDINGTFLNKLYNYLLKPSQEEHLGLFKPTMILVYICAIVIFQYRNKFNSYETLCYNALILTIFFYILLKDIVDLQIRFRDMFFFSLIFLIPYIHEWLSVYVSKRNAYIILMLSFSVYLAKFIIYDKMLVL